jgi:hypothetical protein
VIGEAPAAIAKAHDGMHHGRLRIGKVRIGACRISAEHMLAAQQNA